MEGLEEMKKLLEECNQSHILKYWNDFTEPQQKDFLAHLKSIDFKIALKMLQQVNRELLENDKYTDDNITAASVEIAKETPHEILQEYRNIGLEEISNSKVAVIVLAGGQGTRLGMPYPKGMCPTGIPSGKTLFQLQAEKIQCLTELAKQHTGKEGVIRWYLMTSEATDVITDKYLKQNKYFGLQGTNVKLFKQAHIPCFDLDGKILLEEKDEVAMAPDGNGGIYNALKHQGILEDMKTNGIEYVHVHSVDNILIKIADPTFIGKCIKDEVDFGLKVIPKSSPSEPLGSVVLIKNKFQIIEYSETPKSSQQTDPIFQTGNICNHFYTVNFLHKICTEYETDLKWHCAKKCATQVGPDGDKITPTTVNCLKMEKFIFDVITFTQNVTVWQVERNEEFSPVKNSDESKKDCFATAKKDLLLLHKEWLEKAGGKFVENGTVEISPLVSYEGEGLDKFKGKEFGDVEVILSEKEEKLQERRG